MEAARGGISSVRLLPHVRVCVCVIAIAGANSSFEVEVAPLGAAKLASSAKGPLKERCAARLSDP